MQSQRIQRIIAELGRGLHEKEELVRLTLLAAIAGQNVFLYGPPGVAKSMIARRVAKAFRDAKNFEYLLGRFTTPEEIFGPVSIARLKDADRFERVTTGYLPDAHIAFLDEIWNASSPILNTLLTAINERRFRNGNDEISIPLRSVIGASRTLAPSEEGLENLWDRFLLRLPVQPVTTREAFRNVIIDTDEGYHDPVSEENKITLDELDEWTDAIATVQIPPEIEALIFDVRERIERHNSMLTDPSNGRIIVSDRRWKQAARLLRTSAFLNDRDAVDAIDCILLRHCLWSVDDERETIKTIVEEAVRRYVGSGLFDPETLRDRYQGILKDTNSVGVTAEERREQPVPYRGEYYRVTDFVDDHLSLIWIGDFQNLDNNDTTETDLFFYGDEDEYAYSERFQIRRVGPRSIEIDGVTFDLEHETVTEAVDRPTNLSEEDKQRLRDRLGELLETVVSIEEKVRTYKDASTGEAIEHLFVHRDHAKTVVEGMDSVSGEIALIRSDINAALSGIE